MTNASGAITNPSIRALAIDQVTPTTIYAGTNGGGIFKSTDSGGNWAAMNTGLPTTGFPSPNDFREVIALVIDPSNTSTLYAGTNGSGVFKSTDGGLNWNAVNTGFQGLTIFSLVINPQNPAILYAGTNSGAFKTVNNGGSWAGVNTGMLGVSIKALAIDPSNPAIVYAGAMNQVTSGLGINGGAGVFKTTDGGANWTLRSTGLTNLGIQSLAIDPVTPATIYAGTSGSGVFKSINGGTTWTPTGAN